MGKITGMTQVRRLLRSWLEAERSDADDRSERAAVELFATLALWAPAAGFAQRVLLAVRRESARAASTWVDRLFGHWGVRAAVAVAAVQAGVLAGGALTIGRPLFEIVGPLGLLTGLAGLIARSFALLIEIPRLGLGLVEFGRTLSDFAGSPQLILVLWLFLAGSSTGLFVLSNLLGSQRAAGELR